MNALTTAKPTKLDQLRMEILPPDREHSFFASLPAHVKPERFMRNLDIALMQNQKLMALDPRLIFREISKAAALGLYLDPQLGEAYLIEAWNGKAKRAEPQLRIGYRGLIKLGRQSGEISQIYAHEVHANDVFKASLGDDKKLIHEPDIFGDRGPIVGYYAVVKYKDGDTDFEPLTIAQAHAIRDRSDGWKAFQAGKIKSTPWSTDDVEMSKKGLALDTPIPTPTGWAAMAELEVGREVFDKDGKVVAVTAVSEVKNIPCFRVTFSCGDQVVCDDEHRWLARAGGSAAYRQPFTVQTINELYDAKQSGLSVTIPVQAPLDLPAVDLPIDPYLLGYWLGDGKADGANITCNSDDLPFVIKAAERAGFIVTGARKDARADAHTVKITDGFYVALRENGLLNNKHVPHIYLRASIGQRRQLLCGLMDSDGCIEKRRGRAKFCSTSRFLADAVYELAISLGEVPCRHTQEAKGFGVTTTAYWVEWMPTDPCVTLPRKVANLKDRKITPYRSISAIERVDSVPTKCIAVASQSETYLAGWSMAPTHNTAIRRLVKRIPQSPELAEAIRVEDAAEHSDGVAIAAPVPPRPPLPPVPPQQQIEHAAEDEITDVEHEEVVDEDDASAEEDKQDETADPDTGEVTDEHPADGDGAAEEARAALAALDTALANCTSAEEIVEVWNEHDMLARFGDYEDAITTAKSYKRNHTMRLRSDD